MSEEIRLTVKIKKAKSDVLWYRGKIGQIFNVVDEGKKNTFYLKDKGNKGFIIFKEDVEII